MPRSAWIPRRGRGSGLPSDGVSALEPRLVQQLHSGFGQRRRGYVPIGVGVDLNVSSQLKFARLTSKTSKTFLGIARSSGDEIGIEVVSQRCCVATHLDSSFAGSNIRVNEYTIIIK